MCDPHGYRTILDGTDLSGCRPAMFPRVPRRLTPAFIYCGPWWGERQKKGRWPFSHLPQFRSVFAGWAEPGLRSGDGDHRLGDIVEIGVGKEYRLRAIDKQHVFVVLRHPADDLRRAQPETVELQRVPDLQIRDGDRAGNRVVREHEGIGEEAARDHRITRSRI